jgi:subtilisin family serine protease
LNKTFKLLVPVFILAAVAFGKEEIIKGQLLVQFRPPYRYQISPEHFQTGLAAVDNLGRRFGVSRIEKLITDPRLRQEQEDFGLDRLYLVYFPETINALEAMAAYEQLPEVEAAWPNMALPVFEKPNDPQFGWHLNKCRLPEAWDVSHGDSAIVVCCIDGGVDWTHEDLEKNLWINSEEDINHDGKFTSADLNGIDDDGNGKVDDVIGWNFKHQNPDPKPDAGDPYYTMHGTGTLGTAVAVTNNGKGVASPGWSCRGMAVNTAAGENTINSAYAIQAIQYAANNGARVISLSFGGTGFDPYTGSLAYARAKGCLCFGGAGNDNVSSLFYPAADANAIAVAASDQSDNKSSYSNYGTWIELCAPGDKIVTTSLENTYESPDGTSFACPLVAGITALIWAAHPTWTNTQVEQQLLNTCDPMPDPLYAQGKLGHGRVNAMRALVPAARSYLTLTNVKVDDSAGNNDGVADPGEAIKLIVTLLDSAGWQNAANVSATISTADQSLTLTKTTAAFPNIAAGSSKTNDASPFTALVGTGALPHKVLLIMNKQSSPQTFDKIDSMVIDIGKPKILLVDDDGGKDYERWYQSPLDSIRVLYTNWSVKTQGEPTEATLKKYSTVIWFTGDETTTALSNGEIAALKAFLDNGGKLVISGQNIGETISADPFYADYLHAQFLAGSTGKLFVVGTGDPIGGSDTLAVAGNGGANNATSNDGIAAVAPAEVIFKYKDTTTGAGVRFDGSYRVIYFAFPFEAVDGPGKYLSRTVLMRRLLANYQEYPVAEEPAPVAAPIDKIDIAPNPFYRTATVTYELASPSTVTLKIYDVAGMVVRTLIAESKPAGSHTVCWNGRDAQNQPVPAGVYFYRLESNGRSLMEKAVLVK